jgi:hypothetical protein
MSIRNVRNIASPNYPTSPDQYSRQFQDQYTNILRLFSNSITNSVNAPKVYGSFYDTVTQTNASATAVNLMTLNTTVSAYGVRIGQPTSRVYMGETGVYNIQFSAQLDKSAGAAADVYIWLRVNGEDVPYSASHMTIQGSAAELIAAWNFIVILEADDYFELAWSSTDTNVVIKAATAAAGPPVIPAIPSVILTVSWVSNTVT